MTAPVNVSPRRVLLLRVPQFLEDARQARTGILEARQGYLFYAERCRFHIPLKNQSHTF
jgi:hypothetical protein